MMYHTCAYVLLYAKVFFDDIGINQLSTAIEPGLWL